MPSRDSLLWSALLLLAIISYGAAHCLPHAPNLAEWLKDGAMLVGTASAKLASSPLGPSASRSWLRRLLDAVAAEVP